MSKQGMPAHYSFMILLAAVVAGCGSTAENQPAQTAQPAAAAPVPQTLEQRVEAICGCDGAACVGEIRRSTEQLRAAAESPQMFWIGGEPGTPIPRERLEPAVRRLSPCLQELRQEQVQSLGPPPQLDALTEMVGQAAGGLGQMSRTAVAFRLAEMGQGRFPAPAPLTPPRPCCEHPGGVCEQNVEAWVTEPWTALNFIRIEPAAVQFAFESDDQSFVARAVGTPGCEGEPVVFEQRGSVSPTGEIVLGDLTMSGHSAEVLASHIATYLEAHASRVCGATAAQYSAQDLSTNDVVDSHVAHTFAEILLGARPPQGDVEQRVLLAYESISLCNMAHTVEGMLSNFDALAGQ